MQKKLIALAVAGLVSGAAFAQTNVTVYGVLDVGYMYSKQGDLSFSGLASGGMSGNRVGFRGTEALGNGLNAVFQAEFGFAADQFTSGTSPFTNLRNSWVGFQHGKYGTFTIGRQNSVAYDWVSKGYASDVTVTHPSNLLIGDSSAATAFAQLNTSDRVNNSVKYQSPNWNGFEVRGVYGFGEVVGTPNVAGQPKTEGDWSDSGRYSLGAAYKNGPIDVALIYAGIAKNDTQVNDGSVNGWSLGGSYDFKVVKVFAQYQAESNEKAVSNAKSDIDKKAWTLGVRVPVTKAGTVIAEYVNAKADYNNNTEDAKAYGWGIGYEHAFSKRTTGYTSYGYVNNNERTKAGFGGVGQQLDENNKAFAIGVRHTF